MANDTNRKSRPPGLIGKKLFELQKGTVMWVALLIFLCICMLAGGSNLASTSAVILLWPAAIVLIALCYILQPAGDRSLRIPTLLLAGLTLSIAIQLVPLPPGLWHWLPGRNDFSALSQLGIDDGIWRPISVAPSFTWNSLLATLTGWAIMVAIGRLPRNRDRMIVIAVIVIALASCFVGLFQLAGGPESDFYLYGSDGSISGLLANRNHQAVMLAVTLPMLRVWAARGDPQGRFIRNAIAALLGLIMLGMLLLTGSRSGLLCALVGLFAAYTIAPEIRRDARVPSRALTVLRWILLALPAVLLLLFVLMGRDMSVQRVFSTDYANEIRIRSLPTTLSLLNVYFPFGSGFGTFDAVFRIREPDSILNPTFFNRAHNDYLELAITGGLVPITLLAIALIWAVIKGWHVMAKQQWQESGVLEARAGAVALLILGIASLSDYPVRPPLMSAITMIAICWLARTGPEPSTSPPNEQA